MAYQKDQAGRTGVTLALEYLAGAAAKICMGTKFFLVRQVRYEYVVSHILRTSLVGCGQFFTSCS